MRCAILDINLAGADVESRGVAVLGRAKQMKFTGAAGRWCGRSTLHRLDAQQKVLGFLVALIGSLADPSEGSRVSRPQGTRTRQTATVSGCWSRWLLAGLQRKTREHGYHEGCCAH